MTWECPVKDCPGDLIEDVADDGSGFTQSCWECDFFSHGPPYATEIIQYDNKCPMCDTDLVDLYCPNCDVTYDV